MRAYGSKIHATSYVIQKFHQKFLQVKFHRNTLMTIEQIARIAHETNRAYCQSIGDNSQPPWEDAPEWQRQSAINGAQHHIMNRVEGFFTSPWESHESWFKEKEAAGWKYGPVKDPEKKEHPCMVPYAALPTEQKLKDYLFAAVCRAFHECAGDWGDTVTNS